MTIILLLLLLLALLLFDIAVPGPMAGIPDGMEGVE
jgi:hypothetical protein